MTNKEYIAQRVNKNCTRASCLVPPLCRGR